MLNKVLEAIARFTSEKDVHSMETKLVYQFAALLPITRVSIIKFPEASIMGDYEETLSLSVADGDGHRINSFTELPMSITGDTNQRACQESAQPVTTRAEDGITRLLVPVSFDHKVRSALSLDSKVDLSSFLPEIRIIATVYGNFLAILNESEKDKLTQLFNRKTFDDKLNRMLQMQIVRKQAYSASQNRNERQGLTADSYTWLAILDIDYFKRVNDVYGHLYGDEVLVLLSRKLRSSFRTTDLLFRFGGEEFLIVLEPIPMESAETTLNRFRKVIAEYEFPQIGRITVSIGYARLTDQDYPPSILDQADKALYYAKEHGRNCVFSYNRLLDDGLLRNKQKSGSVDLF